MSEVIGRNLIECDNGITIEITKWAGWISQGIMAEARREEPYHYECYYSDESEMTLQEWIKRQENAGD